MPFIDVGSQQPGEPLPGWHDRYFASHSMSFAYYDVDAGASIHAHWHDEEEVWHIIQGTLEITIDGETLVAGAGTAAVVPPNAVHSVKARTDAKVIIANHPVRERIVRNRVRLKPGQTVDATLRASVSAGVSKLRVSRGR